LRRHGFPQIVRERSGALHFGRVRIVKRPLLFFRGNTRRQMQRSTVDFDGRRTILANRVAEFKELKNPLIVQKADLEQKLAKAEKGQASPIEPLKNLILEANQAQKWGFENNFLEMKSFLQKVGLNREIRSQTLTVSFKKHWCSLAKTTVAANQAASESERNSVWWRRRELKPIKAFRKISQ
jgi:hypothetical protein